MPANTAQHCHAQAAHAEDRPSRCVRLPHDVLPEVPTPLPALERVEYRKAGDSGSEDAVGGVTTRFPRQDVAADYARRYRDRIVLSFCTYA